MNQWPNGQGNGMFPQGHMNPAALYNHTPFDLSQFTQGLQNGNSTSSTPPFPNQSFQPGSLVPAKRTHDGMSGSPVQNQGSRSQTPNYAAFQQSGQQFPNAPTPYAHLQQSNSNNATPSPTMQNQQFRPPSQPPQQRMQNASPSPFPQQQQQQPNFSSQMSPPTSQNMGMSQQNQLAAFNQQFGMNTANPAMANMSNQMSQMSAQKAYQMKLLQHQQQLRSGMIPPQAGRGQQGQMYNAQQQQMGNGQAGGQMNMMGNQQQQQHALKRAQFLKTLSGHAQQNNRTFNPNPTIGGKPVDLYALWQLVITVGGSANIERNGQWQQIATRLGFPDQQFPSAATELRQLHSVNISQYEKLWLTARSNQKQEEARMHAQQMAGLGGPQQGSPTRNMQPPNQQNPYSQFQQNQQNQMQAQSTPVQANAQLPPNGMATPQQQMMQHRRASSVRKPDQMTPLAGVPNMPPGGSPQSGDKTVQGSPPAKQEPGRTRLKHEEPRTETYTPATRPISSDGNYNIATMYGLSGLANDIARLKPLAPTVTEMGVIDVKAISLSLASGIHAEVRYALDALAELTNHEAIQFDLGQTEDLLDVIIDCAEDQIELLSEDAAEVSDALDLASYEDIVRAAHVEAETLQDVPEYGTHAFDLDRAAEKLIAITTVLRNLTFWEQNHAVLTANNLVKWLSNTIRLLGTRNMLLRTFYNTQDFYKDMIIFLSNTTQSLELPSRDDALHILHFLLAFAPQPAPSYTECHGKIRIPPYVPSIHRYLPPAVDSLAKLLARQDPNRMYYNSIFSASSASLATPESPLDLLTRAFALSISVLPDRSKGSYSNQEKVRITDVRKPFMSQGMLAADILTTLAPSNDSELARVWLESEDGWAVGLLDLAAVLSVQRSNPQHPQLPPNPKQPNIGLDYDSFRLIAQRALAMIKRLAEKAGKGSLNGNTRGRAYAVDEIVNGDARRFENGDANDDSNERDGGLKWEVIPPPHTIMGALLMHQADKVALGLLCGLHEMVMKSGT